MVKPPPQWSGDKTNQPATERYRLSLARAKFWRNFNGEPKTKRFRLVNNMSCAPNHPGVNSILTDAHCKCSANKRNGQMYLSFIWPLDPPKIIFCMFICFYFGLALSLPDGEDRRRLNKITLKFAFILGLHYLCLTAKIGGASTKSH